MTGGYMSSAQACLEDERSSAVRACLAHEPALENRQRPLDLELEIGLEPHVDEARMVAPHRMQAAVDLDRSGPVFAAHRVAGGDREPRRSRGLEEQHRVVARELEFAA